jgi:hypothetical protein
MNHPTREEWMSYLYDESTPQETANLAAHLAVCPDCKNHLLEWRTARNNLDLWRLPPKPARFSFQRPLIKWAAAATVIAGVGFGVGHFSTAASADPQAVRAMIEPQIRQQVMQDVAQTFRNELERATQETLRIADDQSRQLISSLGKLLEEKGVEQTQAIYNALNNLDSQRIADTLALRKELETVAVVADDSFRHTEQQLVQLADAAHPTASPASK